MGTAADFEEMFRAYCRSLAEIGGQSPFPDT